MFILRGVIDDHAGDDIISIAQTMLGCNIWDDPYLQRILNEKANDEVDKLVTQQRECLHPPVFF